MARRPGPVFGTPGGSLGASSSWAANAGVAKAGAKMEVRLGGILNQLAERRGVAVFHDLSVPKGPGIGAVHSGPIPASVSRGNIDHAMLGARTLVLIDAKAWRPGFYATIAGTTWRAPGDVPRDAAGKPIPGAKPKKVSTFPHADKSWLGDAIELLGRHLATRGSRVTVAPRALVVVGSSRDGEKVRLWAASSPTSRLMTLEAFERSTFSLVPRGEPDPLTMQVLAELTR